jgi:DNA-binding protein H-NS
MSSLQDLINQRNALDAQIAEAQRADRVAAIEKVRSLMAEYGLTAADLAGRVATGTRRTSSAKGGKVAPKYRDPATGDTWSGRGLQPKWLRAALADGRPLSDFSV